MPDQRIVNEHGISQGMYCKRRDQLLTDGAELFERSGVDHARKRLERENRKLKETIGELTMEFKKRLVKRHTSMCQANQELLLRIQQLKAKHPYWGYRRIWAYLKYHEKLPVNRKRIFRLMKENHLLVPKNRLLKAPRKAKTQKPRTFIPNRYLFPIGIGASI